MSISQNMSFKLTMNLTMLYDLQYRHQHLSVISIKCKVQRSEQYLLKYNGPNGNRTRGQYRK